MTRKQRFLPLDSTVGRRVVKIRIERHEIDFTVREFTVYIFVKRTVGNDT